MGVCASQPKKWSTVSESVCEFVCVSEMDLTDGDTPGMVPKRTTWPAEGCGHSCCIVS